MDSKQETTSGMRGYYVFYSSHEVCIQPEPERRDTGLVYGKTSMGMCVYARNEASMRLQLREHLPDVLDDVDRITREHVLALQSEIAALTRKVKEELDSDKATKAWLRSLAYKTEGEDNGKEGTEDAGRPAGA